MAKEMISDETLQGIFDIVPQLTRLHSKKLWIDYDSEVDTLYVSFRRPQRATDSEMLENGVLVRYRGERIIGLTILEASTRR